MPKIHIWCTRASDSACSIRDGIREAGIECNKTRPVMTPKKLGAFIRNITPGDLIVNWGDAIPLQVEGAIVLNNHKKISKRTQLLNLAIGGILVPEVYDGPGEGRIGRSNNHQGGTDLLGNYGCDYYTQKLNITREFRVHVFRELSIRAGVKVPRTTTPHPWIRSYEGGWKLDYGAEQHKFVKKSVRDIAKRAVTALGLDFGAVDVGMVGNVPVVLEVNLAPGLDEGPSVDAYVRHIVGCVR